MLEHSLVSKTNFWTLKPFGTSGSFLKEKSIKTIYVSMTVLQKLPTSCHPCLKRISLTSCFPPFLQKHIFSTVVGTLPPVSIPECWFWSFQTLNSRIDMMADRPLHSLKGPHWETWKGELQAGPLIWVLFLLSEGSLGPSPQLSFQSGWHTSQGSVRFGRLTFRQDPLSPVSTYTWDS